MATLYVMRDANPGAKFYLKRILVDALGLKIGQTWVAAGAHARKFSTTGDLAAFAEQHNITGYTVEKLDPADVVAMEATAHADLMKARVG